jgi:hypothetical protein
MSALPPKADTKREGWNVRFVPKADMTPIVRIEDFETSTQRYVISIQVIQRCEAVLKTSSGDDFGFGK